MSPVKKKTSGLHGRMWAYFLVLAVVIMMTVWVLQIVLLKTTYSIMKKHQITSFGNEIGASFVPESGVDGEFCDYVYTFCNRNGVSARIFTDEGYLIYSTDLYMFKNGEYKPEPIFVRKDGEDRNVPIPGRIRPRDAFLSR